MSAGPAGAADKIAAARRCLDEAAGECERILARRSLREPPRQMLGLLNLRRTSSKKQLARLCHETCPYRAPRMTCTNPTPAPAGSAGHPLPA